MVSRKTFDPRNTECIYGHFEESAEKVWAALLEALGAVPLNIGCYK